MAMSQSSKEWGWIGMGMRTGNGLEDLLGDGGSSLVLGEAVGMSVWPHVEGLVA